MKKLWKVICLATLSVCTAFTVAACNKDSDDSSVSDSIASSVQSSGVVEKDAPVINNKPANNTLAITNDVNTYQFKATYEGKITWISTVKSVATISDSGLLTMVGAGYTEIIAKDEATGLSDSVTLTIVDERKAETLSISGVPAVFRVGDAAVQLCAVSSIKGEVTASYVSSNPDVATISATGLLTPVAKGTTTITVTAGDLQATVEVNILGAAITSVTMYGCPKYGMLVGNFYDVTATCLPENCEEYEIEWTVDNTSVADFVNGQLLAKAVGECKVTATVKGTQIKAEQTLTVSALSTTNEDFRFAVAGTANVQNVGPTIAYSNMDGEIVEFGADQALKLTTRGNGTNNKLMIDFGTLAQGNYKVSFTYKVLDGRYVGRIFADNATKPFAYVSQMTYQGDDSYCFYFNQADEGTKRFTFNSHLINEESAFLLDDIVLEKVNEIPTEDIGALVNENFDNVNFIDGQTSDIGGVYVSPDVHKAELVDDGNGGKALKVTRLGNENGTGAYGVVAFSLGDLEAGNYKLTLDVENAGYQAIMQVFTFTKANGYTTMKCTQELNYQTLDRLASKDGNTYTFWFNLIEAHENFGIALAASAKTVGESITIDNVKLEEIGNEFTVDFESGFVGVYKNSSLGLTHQEGENWVNDSVEATPYVGITGTLIENGSGFVTENGNTYCKVNFKGWDSWATFNLGYLKAGTYLVSMDAELVSGTAKGRFGYGIANSQITELTQYEKDGNRYTFKIVLAEDCADFNIGYKSISGQDADFVMAFDNITVQEMGDMSATSVEITSAPEGTLNVNDTYDFTATVKPVWAEGYTLAWSVDNDAVGTIDENGKFTAIGEGSCVVTVTVVGTNLTASVTVAVENMILPPDEGGESEGTANDEYDWIDDVVNP